MSLTPDKTVIGFIGTGVMGKSMAGHLLKAGYPLVVYNRTKAKAQELLDQGAEWANTIAEMAVKCDVVITMVGYPQDVEQTYLGDGGLVSYAKKGAYLIDMTTSSPKLAVKISEAAKAQGLHALDAPVSGGDIGAKEARLAIMVGGDEPDFAAVKPILSLMGTNVVHQGYAGAGQHAKMCNQIVIAGNMLGLCEALGYAKKSGLDPANVLKSISTGAASSWALINLAPRILAGNYAPGFYIKHFIKDMAIAIEAAEEMGLDTPAVKQAKVLYDQLAAEGEENSGTQALFKWYDR